MNGTLLEEVDQFKYRDGTSIIADDRSRWAVITAEACVAVIQRRLGVTDIS